jgi:hypothetical protein
METHLGITARILCSSIRGRHYRAGQIRVPYRELFRYARGHGINARVLRQGVRVQHLCEQPEEWEVAAVRLC